MLERESVFIYVYVDWSGYELNSRQVISQLFSEPAWEGIPVFQLDVSDVVAPYVEEWMQMQKNQSGFVRGGWGEILWVQSGEIKKWIQKPFQSGVEGTRKILLSWLG